MRILVMGGTGFVGPALVRHLSRMGHEITVFHRGQTEADLPAGVQHLHGDRANLMDFRRAFERLAPEVAIDVRPLTEADAQAAVQALKGVAGRLVALSSGDVYRGYGVLLGTEPGPPDPTPLGEDAPLRRKLYPYRGTTPRAADDPMRWADDYDKILVERVVLGEPELPGTVLRLPMVYGPGDTHHRLFLYLKRMDDGRPAILLANDLAGWRWTRGYVEDVAAAVARAASDSRAAGRVYNVGEAVALSETEWVEAIGRAAGWAGRVLAVPRERLPGTPPARNFKQDLVMDISRIRRELGYEDEITPAEALRQTVAWERAHPPPVIDPREFDYAAEDAVLAQAARPAH